MKRLAFLLLACLFAIAVPPACSSNQSTPASADGPSGGMQTCDGNLVDTDTDPSHCGDCAIACPTAKPNCVAGTCSAMPACSGADCTCLGTQVKCNGVCVTLATNSSNCGSCGNACPSGQTCANSACQCPAGFSSCNGGACQPTSSDANNCGACGNACQAGQQCTNGKCACLLGSQDCGMGCISVTSDANNCGACGTKCQTGQQCAASACQCLGGLTSCGASCVNTMTDSANCGTCGTACPTGQFCVAGACSATCPQPNTTCGTQCVDTQTDTTNCGTCGTACPAGQQCAAGSCGCPGGRTSCSGSCVDTQIDPANCGMCGKACPAGQDCSAGVCGCAGGQTSCNNVCVDTQKDASNCGMCGKVCAAGTTCTGGACSCPAGQVLCSGTCVTGTACDPAAVDMSCTLNGATVNIPAADVISDFAQTKPIMYKTGVRGGTDWYAYGAEDSGTTLGASTPGVGGNAFSIDNAASSPCGNGALKISSQGNSQWGVGFGVNLMGDVSATVMKKGQYDAQSAGYTGIGFYMKCQKEADFLYVKIVDGPNDADIETPVCSYTTGTICNQYGQKNLTGTMAWNYYKIYFSETLQDWDGGTITNGIKASALTAFQIQPNTQYTRDGNSRVPNPFTCWIDGVHFVKDAPPSASVTPKTCSSGSAAPGGYYTTGNKIMDCKTGQQKIFHGVARPSFEWDRAGWNVTYADLQRIKAYGANVVRYSLNQQFWQDSAKGGLYQAYVDRAVKWTLSLGMDVILDLHWLTTAGQTAISDGNSPAFWSSVAGKYKNDGRVIFELFNEPFCDAGTWKTQMQAMYNAVRNTAGAQNLVLMGGLDYAYDLSAVLPGSIVTGTNIAYVTHPYDIKTNGNVDTAAWDSKFGNLSATYPIIATEFGQANTTPGGTKGCNASFYNSMLSYFKTKNIGWTGWAWYVDRGVSDPSQSCGFPQLITQYDGTTNAAGTAVKAAF